MKNLLVIRLVVAVFCVNLLTIGFVTADALGKHDRRPDLVGVVSWHDKGARVVDGGDELTAAHAGLPPGTLVEVWRPVDGRAVVVRIDNERGPGDGRIMTLSEAAAHRLGLEAEGTAVLALRTIRQGPIGRETAGRLTSVHTLLASVNQFTVR